jgi:hypothetical protein
MYQTIEREMKMVLELKATDRRGECKDSNWYVDGLKNFGQQTFEDWLEFKEAYGLTESFDLSHDYAHCFRFDIKEELDAESDEPTGNFGLFLYMVFQGKGDFVPVRIKQILQEDMGEIQEYLASCWRYLQGQWTEFSGVESMYPLNKG